MAWGQAVRQTGCEPVVCRDSEGEGRSTRRLQISRSSFLTVCTRVVESPDLQIKSKAPFHKDCQLCPDEMPPTLWPSCPHPSSVLPCSVLFCSYSFLCTLSDFFPRSWSDGKTWCCIFDSLLASVQLSLKTEEEL